MFAGDVLGLVMLTVCGVAGLVVMRRDRRAGLGGINAVKLESLAGLILGGLPFVALGIALLVFAAFQFRDPMGFSRVRRLGDVHNWLTGILAVLVGLLILWVGTLLWRKAAHVVRERRRDAAAALAKAPPPAPSADEVIAAVASELRSSTDVGDLSRLARRYLQAAHGAPGTAGTTAELVAFLRDSDLSPTISDRWAAVLADLDTARYSGTAATDGDTLARRIRRLLGPAR